MKYHYTAYHAGLGDHLQYSTLPEMLTKLGHKVHLWEKAEFRNPGIKDLIMRNPYILPPVPGAEWNLGDIPGLPYENTQKCFIMNWEKSFGLEPTNCLPKIYYEPKQNCKFGGIIELSAIHHKYNPEILVSAASQLMEARKDVEWHQLVSPAQSNLVLIPGVPTLEISDIFQLCDVIAQSCIFASCMSGQHSLAAAIQRINPHFEQFCFIPEKDFKGVMESKKFIYPNVEYYQT